MQVPKKQQRKRRLPGNSQNCCIRYRAERKGHVWSYDFVTDSTEDGRQFKILAVIDEYTRECLALEVGRSFTADDVVSCHWALQTGPLVGGHLWALQTRPLVVVLVIGSRFSHFIGPRPGGRFCRFWPCLVFLGADGRFGPV